MRKPVLLISIGIIVIILWNLKNDESSTKASQNNSESVIDSSQVTVNSATIEHGDSTQTIPSTNIQSERVDTLAAQCDQEDANPKDSENYHIKVEKFIESLSQSEKVEDKLSYALYHRLGDNETRLDLILSFHNEHPTNTDVLYELMLECSLHPKDPRCSYELIENILQLDPNNDTIWANAFNYFAAHRDTDKLSWAYEEALKAPYSTNYYAQNILRYVDTLEAGGNTDFNRNLLAAIGTEAARASSWNHLVIFCNTNARRKDLAGLCIDITSLIENANTPNSDNMIARAIQKNVYRNIDNEEQVELIEQKMKKENDFMISQYFNASNYLFHDESLTREWLVQFKNFGEFAAAEYVVEEVEIRTQDENYFPCLRQSL